MLRRQIGFTLIELMIVVAIIGILAAVAIPMYQHYVIRAQISEGLELASGAKAAVSDYYMNNGAWPADNAAAALADGPDIKGSYTEHVVVEDNVIEVRFGHDAHNDINGGTVTLTALDNDGSISWTCINATRVQPRHLPGACR